MTKPSRETIRKRIATRRRNAAKRKRLAARYHERCLDDSPELAAKDRLHKDGAGSKENIRRRILVFAAERGLPKTETAFAGRLATGDFISFSKRHNVSMDWLLTGDLKGLLRTVRGCPSRPQRPTLTPAGGDGDAA